MLEFFKGFNQCLSRGIERAVVAVANKAVLDVCTQHFTQFYAPLVECVNAPNRTLYKCCGSKFSPEAR